MLIHIVFKTLIKYSKIILPIGLVITFSGAHLERIDYHSSAIYISYLGLILCTVGITFWPRK